jgi:hypothetical protein
MEVNYFLIRVVGLIINILLLWWISKLLKFKRNKIEYAFLLSAIMFVFTSIFEMLFFYIFDLSFLTLIFFVFIIGPVGIFLWFYLINKIYKISFKQALKVALILFLIGLVISPLLSILFSYESPYAFASNKNLSCEEKYNTFPYSLSGNSEDDIQLCLYNEAADKKNPLICEKTDDPTSCYIFYARHAPDEEYCEKSLEEIPYICYSEIAREKNDKSICSYLPIIEDGPQRGRLYCEFEFEIDNAITQNNLAYCDTIESKSSSEHCYIIFAKAKLDRTICNNLVDGKYYSVSDCVESVKRWENEDIKLEFVKEYWLH